ncbi:hypothetical protein Rhopal_004592-T1 [Rhodotorula paludigena]|uniref:Tubulin-tyrosine ligase n=1 Tax=Rhodotorula paludigena TaxID=86838 RepID=A0AAV5GM42_9BASI|nr:hypothetical protein Rhopal_004592-T1 [Rhodotorula paludigena]
MASAVPDKRTRTALVQYPPSQRYVVDSLRTAFSRQLPGWTLFTSAAELADGQKVDLQWSDYDALDWDLAQDEHTLLNSFCIRKGLIRKSNLAHTIALYLSKNPDSSLRRAAPKTFHFSCSFADELDELLMDDLYEVDQSFVEADAGGESKWWILKAALADKGNGIRLFNSRETLEEIFQEFEPESDDDEEEEEEDKEDETRPAASRAALFGADTRVDATQLREWVIQEYVSSPLLLDPAPDSNTHGTKFHLRVYVLAVGGLAVYVHHPYLALFASSPYQPPAASASESGEFDLSAHLTNTCLQTSVLGEEAPSVSVSTLQSMADKVILGGPHEGEKLSEERISRVEESVREAVAEVFKAAVGAGSSFQALPNAFEIFGLDFLVDSSFQVSLLEVNATGAELQGIIDHLFACTIDTAVKPFFARQDTQAGGAGDAEDKLVDTFERLHVGGSRGLKEVLRVEISRAW